MLLVLNVILSVAFGGALVGVVQVWRRRRDDTRRDDLQALAARRGWALNVTEQRLGRASTMRITPRGGHRWTAETRNEGGNETGQTAQPLRQITEYEADEPRWLDGTMIVTLARSETTDGDAKMRVRLLGEDAARHAAQMPRVPSPAGLVVLADVDPAYRFDFGDIERLMATWQPLVTGERGAPILVLSPEGVRLTVRHRIVRADHMERFIDLALGLSRLIKP